VLPFQIPVSDLSAHHSLSDHTVNTHAVKSLNPHPIVAADVLSPPADTYGPPVASNPDVTQVLPPKKPTETHDNHQHISKILEKLRNNGTDQDDSNLMWHRRISKRSLFGKWTTKKPEEEYRPTVITHEDRWMAGKPLNDYHKPVLTLTLPGCLMQCIYRKNDAVDQNGYPTLDGLVDLYTAGISEQGFFLHVMRSADTCDCLSDAITEYCS
jgi:hypothetical protein